jgi:hypothetical protein
MSAQNGDLEHMTPQKLPTQPSETLFSAWPDGPLGPTFLTSFTFDPFFFEAQLLPELQRRDAFPIVVFVDTSEGYLTAAEAGADLQHLGRDYYLVGVHKPRGVFHAKIHFFGHRGVALVGSGNLTNPGCGGNLEAFERIVSTEDGAAIREVRSFFRDLITEPSTRASNQLRDSLLSLISEDTDPVATGSARFLHTLHGGITAGFLGHDFVGRQAELLLAAPFHDLDHRTTRDLAAGVMAERICIAGSSRAPRNQPSLGIVGRLAIDNHDRRHLHAKVIHGRGKDHEFTVVGSANLTRSAWEGRNIEAIVVRLGRDKREEPEPSAFSPLDCFEVGKWEGEFEYAEPEASEDEIPGWIIESATLHNKLLVTKIIGEVEGPQFFVRTGDHRLVLAPANEGEGLWVARLEYELECTAILEILDAHGYRARTVVIQSQLLQLPPYQRRMLSLSKKLGNGSLFISEQLEALAWLTSLVLPAARPTVPSSGSERPVAYGSQQEMENVGTTTAHAIQDTLGVHSLHTRESASFDSMFALLNRISDAASGYNKTGVPDSSFPDPFEDDSIDSKTADAREARQRGTDESMLDHAIIEVATQILERDYSAGIETREQFVNAYESGLRILAGRICRRLQARNGQDQESHFNSVLVRNLARLMRDLLQAAWGAPLWGRARRQGVFLLGSVSAMLPSVEDAKAALALAHRILATSDDEGNEDRHDLDWASSILTGLEKTEKSSLHVRPGDNWHPVVAALAEEERTAIIASLAATRPKAETAYEQLEDLRRLVQLQQEISQLENDPIRAGDLESMEQQKKDWFQKLFRRSPELARAWKAQERSRDGVRIFAPTDGTCPKCFCRLPTGVESRLMNADNFAVCENCRSILLPGPLFG